MAEQGGGFPGRRSVNALRSRFLGLVVVLLALGLVAPELLAASANPGDAAPDVVLGTAKGDFRLSQQKGKILVLYFSFPG